MPPILSTLILGVLLGLRHALEPDHLAAVSTLVAEGRFRGRGALLGACWGLGHSVSLVAVGLVLTVLQAQLPARIADLFELAVAVMLLVLGARGLRRSVTAGREGAAVLHTHAGRAHSHPGASEHLHLRQLTLAWRPLCVGLVHGLAGSGALMALAMATLQSNRARLLYMALFGLGSVLGMALLSGLLGWPLARLGHKRHFAAVLAGSTGALSAALGVWWALPILSRLLGA